MASEEGDIEELTYRPVTDPLEPPPSCCHASKKQYRFIVLFTNCLLTFGPYFCFDMPSVLQDVFVAPLNCSTLNTTNCHEGLGLTQTKYNLLYTVYAFMNALIVIASGFMLDKLGNQVCILLFSGLCVIGSSAFAAGLFLKGQPGMFPLFMLGRLLFGAGNGSLTIVQNRISAFWFEGKELAFAFGCTLAFSRLGSVLNFLLTEDFMQQHGLKWTLWGGAILCGLSFMAGIVVIILDAKGTKELNMDEGMKKSSKKMRFSDIKYFRLQFWLLVFTTMFFYNGVFPFVADASDFIQETFHFSKRQSSYIAGAVYDVSMIFSPGMGIVIDYFGMRGILATSCSVLTIPVFGILSFTTAVHPLISMIWLGCTYSVAAASLWPSVPLVIEPAALGTALGIMTSVQMIGIGLCNFAIGGILDHWKSSPHRWKFVMLFLLANTLSCVTISLTLNLVDWKRGGILNKKSKRKRNAQKIRKIPGNVDFTESDSFLHRDEQERFHSCSSSSSNGPIN
eukprot:gene13794-15237_t